MPKNHSYTGRVLAILPLLKKGDSFCAPIQPSVAIQYAKQYGVKIKTEVCLVMEDYKTADPSLTRQTKITIIE